MDHVSLTPGTTSSRLLTAARCRVPARGRGLTLALVVGHLHRRAGTHEFLIAADLVHQPPLGDVSPGELELVLGGDRDLDGLPTMRHGEVQRVLDRLLHRAVVDADRARGLEGRRGPSRCCREREARGPAAGGCSGPARAPGTARRGRACPCARTGAATLRRACRRDRCAAGERPRHAGRSSTSASRSRATPPRSGCP